MYAVVVAAAAAVIIVIVLLLGGFVASLVWRSGYGTRCVRVCYIPYLGESEQKEKKQRKETKTKKREELECVGGVISRKITGAGTVCTYGCGCCGFCRFSI